MGFLFKTTLTHLGKNLPIVSVLSFFVGSGVIVLSSTNNLSDNLNKGFSEVNFDSNPHDLVLVNKSFKPSEKLDVDPNYNIDLKSIDMSVNYGYKWSFNSNNEEEWFKDTNATNDKKFTSQKKILSIPFHNKTVNNWQNYVLMCFLPNSFVSTLSKQLSFLDVNKTGFEVNFHAENAWHVLKLSDEDRKAPVFAVSCDDGSSQSSHDYSKFREFFGAVLQNFQNFSSKDFSSKDLTSDELLTIHRSMRSFNPKKFFVSETGSRTNKFFFRPLFEEDFYFSFDLPFINKLNGNDISRKFKQLVNEILDSNVFYKLNDEMRNSVQLFQKTSQFEKLESKYYISSLSKNFVEFTSLKLPMIMNLNYDEIVIFFIKLFLWDVLSKTTKISDIEESLKFQTSQTVAKISNLLDTLQNDLNDLKDLKKWSIHYNNNSSTPSTPSKPLKLVDYLFSSFSLSDVQSDFRLSHSYDQIKSKSEIVSKLKKWINNTNNKAETLASLKIRSDDQLAKAKAKASQSTEALQFDNFYSKYPSSFKEVYEKFHQYIIDSIKNYLIFLNIQNLKIIKKFINDHELFTLSFLLYNFQYKPSLGIKLTSSQNLDDFDLSLSYHKSLVVTNPANISAKLNDESRTNHAFKIITQERKSDVFLNRLKIYSGNPLFESQPDHKLVFSNLLKTKKEEFVPAWEYRDVYKLLYRAKYNSDGYSSLFKKIYDYISYEFPDPWSDGKWVSMADTKKIYKYGWQVEKYAKDVKTQGSRLILNFLRSDTFSLANTFEITNDLDTVFNVGYIDQFSSFFALVSPFYAKVNNIKPISNEQYFYFKNIVESPDTTQKDWELAYASFILNPQNSDHIVNVNGNRLIVVGTALSPDFTLPSHSWLNLVPNKEKEALIFVDDYGFRNIKYNSLSSWDEFYLSISYPQQVRNLGIEKDYELKLMNYINDFTSDGSGNSSDDLDFVLKNVKNPESNDLVFLRTNYVDNFLGAVNFLSSFLLFFMSAIIFFTVWVMIKKYISVSLNTFGVFVANGITRSTIILNSMFFVLIPACFGTIVGYMLSLGLQSTFFNLFSDIWYLNPVFSGFSISSLLYYLVIVSGLIAPISFLSCWLMLRNNVSNLMKVNSVFKQNRWIKYAQRFLDSFSSLWKFRFFIILNTLSRGFVLSAETICLFVFSSFLFNNYGQFAHVSDMELKSKDYGFDLIYDTPTDQSDQYLLMSYKNLGDTFLDHTPHEKNVVIRKNNSTYEFEKLKFDKDNPEFIGSNIYSPYIFNKIHNVFKNWKDYEIKKWHEKVKFFNADYPSRLFISDPYNIYIFKSDYTSDDKSITDLPTSTSDFKLPKFDAEIMHIFYSSSKSNSNDSNKFNPEIKTGSSFSVGDYVPTKDEKDEKDEQNMLKFGNEPLFKPLIDYYKKKEPLYKNPSSSTSDEFKSWDFVSTSASDFKTLGQHQHPTLRRLFKDHSNYWLFSYKDLEALYRYPVFFKNKVILSFLFNHDWTFNILGKIITVNPWNEFSDFFSKYSPELVAAMNDNYVKFVDAIIHSRYAEYFVNRFMTKHNSTSSTDTHNPGSILYGKKTWKVAKDKIKENLKTQNEVDVEDGLYWFDASKIIYFYDKYHFASILGEKGKTSDDISNPNHPERFVIFRPDFLYLFYALMKDPDFLKEDIAPIKVVFGQNVYTPDYSKPFDEWSISGDVTKDDAAKKGFVSQSIEDSDYSKNPSGDQTYTYIEGDIKDGLIQKVKVIGLKKDPRGSYVKLTKDNEIINEKLYETKTSSGEYPVILNHFALKKLGLKIGDTFKFSVNNRKDRFTKKLKGDDSIAMVNMKIVDVFDSYYNPVFFISQKHANEILGLDPDYGYNAIFTKKENDSTKLPMQLSRVISAFSPSGIYSRQKIGKSSNDFHEFLNKTAFSEMGEWYNHKLSQPKNHEWFRVRSGLPKTENLDSVEGVARALENAYGAGDAITSIAIGVTNANLFNNFVFGTVSDLVISIMNLFMSIFSPLLICSLLIITTLIIEDLKNLLTILNLLGFTYVENSVSILLYLGLVLGFATIVSIPFSSLLLSFYVDKIFNLLNIYLPIYLRFDYAVCSFLILFGMFGFSYWTSMKKIKGLHLPVAMKQISE